MLAAAQESRGGGDDSERERGAEHQQAHRGGSDLCQCPEADHRSSQAEVGREVNTCERLSAVLRRGDFADRADRSFEHQAGTRAGEHVPGKERREAR